MTNPRRWLPAFLFLSCAATPLAAQAPDWKAVEAEALEHFLAILKIPSVNPPGGETPVAEYLKRVLDKEGIEAKLLAQEPGRANLVARLKGSGAKKPVMIAGHTDVVGVQRDKWTTDPFDPVRKDGYIWARGASDDKHHVVAGLMLMLMLKRQNVKLDRDVIFVAEAGEESFWPGGMRFLIANHWPEIEAEYCLAEGGGGVLRDGKAVALTVAATEKTGRGVRLIARGTAGHGSVPRPDNAIGRLSNAISKVVAWLPPMRLNDITRSYFEKLSLISTPEDVARFNGLFDPEKRAEIEEQMRQKDLRHNSMLRTSISPTMLKAGFRQNVIPSEAEAYLDIRAVPGEDIQAFYAMMRKVINDPNIEIVPAALGGASAEPPPPSRLDTEMYAALDAAAKQVFGPQIVTIPTMLTGGTDMTPLRAKGVQSYGIGPLVSEKDAQDLNGIHGDNERILEAELYRFIRFQHAVVVRIAAAK
jgi:acetylornithine deacetylase/succinyl-diaminopimelate desuccinylase-like protein